ncbi:hypothetical protein GYMLUDRAFT_753202 [Collybiopsis luxurians FD-317 M1]|uniref:Uncharacterized protein n=1 Tax=Collybiopsis luxurians FD-317 M1 TaxID=944289 RepID=A0A0D0B312_9AGAR|nr:hypothetical protein GYMLUDRAFT_753202 [Collybiopsis luxurians FD-317 M1]
MPSLFVGNAISSQYTIIFIFFSSQRLSLLFQFWTCNKNRSGTSYRSRFQERREYPIALILYVYVLSGIQVRT